MEGSGILERLGNGVQNSDQAPEAEQSHLSNGITEERASQPRAFMRGGGPLTNATSPHVLSYRQLNNPPTSSP